MAWPKGVPRKPRPAQTEEQMSETGTAVAESTERKIGALTFSQFREVVALGLPITEAKAWAEDGFEYDQLVELALATSAKQAKGGGGLTREEFQQVLDEQRRGANPSNPDHPGISAFSHPEGDRAHPKPPLPFQLFWNGYPVHKFPETETWREWELQGQLKPGEFKVMRKDGSSMLVTAKAEQDADGKVTKLEVTHPCTREDKDKIPGKVVLIHQMLHQENVVKAFEEGMHEQLTEMLRGR